MAFELLESSGNGIRIGEMNGKKTPRFFMINDFGGGGTNVSRFFVYLPLFTAARSELLLNYYYLNTKFTKTPAFNTKLLNQIRKSSDIRQFIEHARKEMIEGDRHCLPKMQYEPTMWKPIVLLDSGSGNVFRDISGQLNETNFESIFALEVKEYISFCESLKFDIAISLDIAGKYTWKKGENEDKDYQRKLETFSNPKWNLILERDFLTEIPEASHVSYYAAIHGKTPLEYLNYLDTILGIETEVRRRFAGFALGGLGNSTKETIYETVRTIRSKLRSIGDQRPIHVLGVGSVQNILPLGLYGADTFDCHSPWRRASEDKLIVPLLDSNFNVLVTDESYWKYVPLDILKDLKCDCEVCRHMNLAELKKLKRGGSEESIYFRIVAYKHNIHQQEVLCELLRSGYDLSSVIERIPRSKYKTEIQNILLKKNQMTLSS